MPQGSSGTSLIYFYTQSLSNVICQSGHSYHVFTDDYQLHNSSISSDFPALVHSLKDFIEDVAEWMSDSTLNMNNDKTELIAIGTSSSSRSSDGNSSLPDEGGSALQVPQASVQLAG